MIVEALIQLVLIGFVGEIALKIQTQNQIKEIRQELARTHGGLAPPNGPRP